MNLRAFQEEMKNLVFIGKKTSSTSTLWNGPVPARLRVYRNNAQGNWMDTLNSDFPLTKKQFKDEAWSQLAHRFFTRYAPAHWELNTSMTPFVPFLKHEKVPAYIKELSDFEWSDLHVFIDRTPVKKGAGTTNPTALVRVYRHQLFYWVEAGAPAEKPPEAKAEVLVFYRDAKNTCHIVEGDPLMLLVMDHFKTPGATLSDLEPIRKELLPNNHVPLQDVSNQLHKMGLLL